MIAIASPFSRPSPRHWRAPGGFFWWYFDHLDARGTGCVCIASFALPFLPGVTSEARAGRGLEPEHVPSLNVAVYEERQLVDYYLITGAKAQASYDQREQDSVLVEELMFGESTLSVARGADTTQLVADLSLPVPGSAHARTKISIRATGSTVCSLNNAPGDEGDGLSHDEGRRGSIPDHGHRWALICPNLSVDARVEWADGRELLMSGHGYLDRNDSLAAIDQLGIERWHWGRAQVGEVTYVWYLLDGKGPSPETIALGFEISRHGEIVRRELEIADEVSGRRLFGMTRPTRCILTSEGRTWLTLTEERVVDDGPFYLRVMQQATVSDGRVTLGYSEFVQPDRVDLARHRPLVRMRITNLDRASSIWLPLFSGPRRSRWRRLLHGWTNRLFSTKRLGSEAPPSGRLE